MTIPFIPDIAVVMRDDAMLKTYRFKRVTIDTSYGPVHRCYYGIINETKVLVIYGRFEGQKVPSQYINAQQTIEAVVNSGAKVLIGTFIVGGINPNKPIGSVYIIDDLVGMGNYQISWNQRYPFHNAEVFQPVCDHLTKGLVASAHDIDMEINYPATYVCFHGYPRIETKAELNFYHKMGWDVVGQTMDPEATLARLNGLCYAGIAVQIDDPQNRGKLIKSGIEEGKKEKHTNLIKEMRIKSSQIVLNFIKSYIKYDCPTCNKLKRTNNSFKQFPEVFYE
jgi:purine nucleoside phosphorylase